MKTLQFRNENQTHNYSNIKEYNIARIHHKNKNKIPEIKDSLLST